MPKLVSLKNSRQNLVVCLLMARLLIFWTSNSRLSESSNGSWNLIYLRPNLSWFGSFKLGKEHRYSPSPKANTHGIPGTCGLELHAPWTMMWQAY